MLAASFLLYALTHVIPGDPIRALFGFRPPPPEVLAELRGRYGLDDPFYVQYFKFLGNASRLDFGYSTRGETVREIVVSGLPVSLRLAGLAMLIQIVFGIGLGVVAALTRSRIVRRLIGAATIVLIAIPVMVIAFGLQTYIGFNLRLLPISGVAQGWTGYILPAVALAAGATAYTIRLTTSEVRSTMSSPFVTTAKGKGLPHRRIVGVHVLRPSLLPIITLIAATAAQIIGGLIIVEVIFEIPGIGSAVVDAIRAKDHNVIVAILALAVLFAIAATAVVDLLHVVIDPRLEEPTGADPG
jgi:oligopeptide transport system permease protein